MNMMPHFAAPSDLSMIIYGRFCIRDIWVTSRENGKKLEKIYNYIFGPKMAKKIFFLKVVETCLRARLKGILMDYHVKL